MKNKLQILTISMSIGHSAAITSDGSIFTFHQQNPAKEAIAGFEDVKPMVFAGIYPVDTEDFEELRSSMEKLQLNDASLVFTPESSGSNKLNN